VTAAVTSEGAGGPGAAPLGVGRVPESVVQALLLSRYQFRDYLRSRRFILMMGIVGAIAAILITLVAHFRPPALVDSATAFYGSLWVGGVEVLIVFAGIIYGGDAIAGEFQNKTGYFLMSLPVRRGAVYAGKYLAAYAAAAVAVLTYLVILIGFGAYYLGAGVITAALFESLALALLYLAALLGTTFLFSSLFKTSAYGVLVVAVMFLFGFSILNGVLEDLVKIEPWFIITYANQVIQYPLVGVARHMIPGAGPAGDAPTYLEGVLNMFGYFVGTTLGGLLLFEREEFT
jgi:ABC-2 type transport system permease protein